MKDNYQKLKKMLSEMFQMDQADLDFGIYRIMNQKRSEIEQFLDNDLLPQVKQAFTEYTSVDRLKIEEELGKLRKTLEDAGVDPQTAPKYQDLLKEMANSVDIEALEQDVYSDLVSFFSRYYDNGDFLSRPRYKDGVYAIPYKGEEVKLHWANADQYYIKTTEYFRDYTFILPSGQRIHFKVMEASTEQNNNKEESGKERRFVLCEETPFTEENEELIIRFEYKIDPSKQDKLSKEAFEYMQVNADIDPISKYLELFTPSPTEANPNRTLLEKHLNEYTARNTFDYFIHKDLGGFLRRELDFYIKNEVLFIDDIDNRDPLYFQQSISKVKVIKKIALKIIAFLEQLENFQKKLWLKKKFVIETNYCITLDRVPEELYAEIASNQNQIEEWKRLFAIDEIEDYMETISVEFLKDNPFLVLDTAFFDKVFMEKLLDSMEDIEEQMDGLLIHSENFQALNLMQVRYKEQIKCVYIDPPYNINGDGFIYKDGYKESSWMTMIYDRIRLSTLFIQKDGVSYSSIGKDEEGTLRLLLDSIWKQKSMPYVWKSRAKPTNAGDAKYRPQIVAEFVFQNSSNNVLKYFPLNSREIRRYNNHDELGNYRTTTILTSNLGRYQRETMRFEVAGYIPPPDKRWKAGFDEIQSLFDNHRLGFNEDGEPYRKHYDGDESEQHIPLWTYIPEDISGTAENGKSELSDIIGIGHGYDTVKPKELLLYLFNSTVGKTGIIFDYFAGSGTTGHAVIKLNREDDGKRKYILAEMGNYFDTILKQRIQKVIYSKDWKDGRPVSREGSSHMFKYIQLESYEDSLCNLEMKRSDTQQILLGENSYIREQYMLSYMLNIESQESHSLLNLDQFEDPFNYKLKVYRNGENKTVTVDLVETFNYLLGLQIRQTENIRGFKVVRGELLNGERVLIIWRNTKEKKNEDLDEFFEKQGYNTLDFEFDRIYVNGDNNLQNIKKDEEHWKVYLIEQEFKRLMFDVSDI